MVPPRHPIRRIQLMADRALAQLSPTFARMYAQNGRASIPPEHLLKACLCFGAHVLMDNREGLVVDVRLTPADGAGERDAALEMLASAPGTQRITVGADRGYDSRGFVKGCRSLKVTPHVAQRQRSAIDGRTTRHEGYRSSQRTRKRVEEVFGWVKTVAVGRKLRYCGIARNRLRAELTIAGYNLVRLAKLTAAA